MRLSRWITGLGILAVTAGSLSAQGNGGQLAFTNSPPTAVIGTSYAFQFNVTGGIAPYTFFLNTDTNFPASFPPGLTFSNGAITGIPTKLGTYNFEVDASDANADFGRGIFTINVVPCTPGFAVTSPLPAADVNGNYSFQFKGTGCSPPYSFSGPSPFGGGIPNGLTLDSRGLLSGQPAQSGVFNFPVTVTEGGGGNFTATFSLTVNPAAQLSTPSPLPNGIVGAPYGPITFTVSGGSPPFTFEVSQVPPGLSMTSTGVLSGTPKQTGTFQFTVDVVDSVHVTSNPKTYQVTFTSATAQLQVSPGSLAFSANGGGDNPTPQYVDVVPSSAATPPYSFTVLLDSGQSNSSA